MNLLDLARSDNKSILGNVDTGFSKEITLHNLDSQNQTVNAFNIRTVQELDPETGIMVNSSKTALNINLSDITIGKPTKRWTVEFTDYEGVTIEGEVIRADYERTFGYVSLIIGV